MKWIALLGAPILLTACASCPTRVVNTSCCQTTAVVSYTKVGAVAPVVEPVFVDVGYIAPIDVTTTTIDFY